MATKETDNIKVLDKAMTVLDIIRESDKPLGVNEISKLSSVNLTTTFRILKTLKSAGWVYQDDNDKYIVGYKISFVTEKNNFYLTLKEIAYYTMKRLSTLESQAMNLVVRECDKCFILQQSRTEKIFDYVPPMGTELPLYASACGKILISELPSPLLDEIIASLELKPLTKHTITTRNALLTELETVKQQGYAFDMHESMEEGYCIGTPIRDKDGEIVASISFSGFIGSIPPNSTDYYVHILHKAAKEIMDNIYKFK